MTQYVITGSTYAFAHDFQEEHKTLEKAMERYRELESSGALMNLALEMRTVILGHGVNKK